MQYYDPNLMDVMVEKDKLRKGGGIKANDLDNNIQHVSQDGDLSARHTKSLKIKAKKGDFLFLC